MLLLFDGNPSPLVDGRPAATLSLCMIDLNPALRSYQENRFTDGDIVGCTGLTIRALRELLKVGAVRSVTERRGPGRTAVRCDDI